MPSGDLWDSPPGDCRDSWVHGAWRKGWWEDLFPRRCPRRPHDSPAHLCPPPQQVLLSARILQPRGLGGLGPLSPTDVPPYSGECPRAQALLPPPA